MTTITRNQIQDRLQITAIQLEMAEFSGLIPESETGVWEKNRIEPFLLNWESKLSRKQPKSDNILKSGNMVFPKHQR